MSDHIVIHTGSFPEGDPRNSVGLRESFEVIGDPARDPSPTKCCACAAKLEPDFKCPNCGYLVQSIKWLGLD